jgi:hypothetical protein
MKKISLFFAATIISATLIAQNEKFVNAMQPKIASMDSMREKPEALQELANSFARIGDAEKTQWLPYYYAALATVNAGNAVMMGAGMGGGMADKLDPIADKADGFLSKAESLSQNNSEIFVVRKMIASLRMMGDPMTRYMTYGPQGEQALEKAKQLNADNPRIYYLQGIDKFYTPEQYGGSKEEAKKLFEESLKKFDTYKLESTLHPNWGKAEIQYFMSQMK